MKNPAKNSSFVTLNDAERLKIARRGQHLELFTIGWNLAEAALSIGAGWLAGSTALVGFGFDSLIEIVAGAALFCRLRHEQSPQREKAEAAAQKWVGWSFLLLAFYIAGDAFHALVTREAPQESYFGITIAFLSLVFMPVLACAKRHVATQLQSRAMQADSKQTDLCAYLSAILLVGLLFNSLFGWWWADPIAALAMVPIIFKEGFNTLRGHGCDCHSCK